MRCSKLLSVLSTLALALCIAFTTASAGDTGTWSAAGPMAYQRYHHSSSTLPDGRILVVGGHFKMSSPAEVFDPKSNGWSIAGWPRGWWGENPQIVPLRNGKLLVVGGPSPELYDPATNTWTNAGTMLAERYYGATATMMNNGKVLVAGGGMDALAASAEVYDPDTNSWTAAPSMAVERYGAASVLLPNGKVLVAGGETDNSELYDPVTNTWSGLTWLEWIRYGHTLTMLPDGKVLVAGGYLAETSQIYDPATNTWSNSSPMPVQVHQHTATLLRDGTVLVVGGITGSAAASPDAWLYDPRSNTWSHDSSMSIGRFGHSAALLQDGNVLVAGGRISSEYPMQDASLVATSEIRSPLQIQGPFTISGTARQGGPGGPALRGVDVAIGNNYTSTDSTGAFILTDVPAGTYTFYVYRWGYFSATVTDFVVNKDMSGLEFYLVGWYSMSGMIHEGSDTGPALAGATISVAGRKATSDSTGAFSVSGIPPGIYTVYVSKAGYPTRTITGFEVFTDISNLNYYLTSVTYTIGGTIRQGSSLGPGLEGATVQIGDKVATTGSTGSYSIPGVPAGTYTLTISKSGFQTKTITGFVVNRNMSAVSYYLKP